MLTDMNLAVLEQNSPLGPLIARSQIGEMGQRLFASANKKSFSQADSGQGLRLTEAGPGLNDFAVLLTTLAVSAQASSLAQLWLGIETKAAQSAAMIDQLQAVSKPVKKSAWDVLASMIGTVHAPADWAAEHDHYLYGTPKRG